MKKNMSKMLSVVLSATMVISSVTFANTPVKAELTTEEMVADGLYNLALGKNVDVAPSLGEGKLEVLTDGKFTPGGDHAATTFNTTNTYYEIDLESVYDLSTLDQLVIGYKEKAEGDTPVNGYEIQASANGYDFKTVKKVDGASVKEAWEKENLVEEVSLEGTEGKARYIRVLYPDAYGWGIQITEIALLDVNGDAAKVEVEKCDDAKSVKLETSDCNTISYTIEAGENQEDYKYNVYLDGKKLIGKGVDAGTAHMYEGVDAGAHTVKVVSVYDGKASEGITSEQVFVQDISELVSSKKNITNKNNNWGVTVKSVSGFYDGHTITTAQVALDGKLETGEDSSKCIRTETKKDASIVIDLGDYYTPEEMDRVLLAYANGNTYASNVQVDFSLNGEDYTNVGKAKDYKFSAENGKVGIDKIKLENVSDFTEKAVRFVKVTLSGGSNEWGYCVNEISLLANTEDITIVGSNIAEAADIEVDNSVLEQIKYSIVPGENQEDAEYVVQIDGVDVNTEAKANVSYESKGLTAGTHQIKVSKKEDGWLSKGITKTVIVDGYINYINSSINLAYKSGHKGVVATCDTDNRGDNYVTGSQEISAGPNALIDGIYTNNSHHSGYLQTRPDKDESTIVYDLGTEYKKSDIHSVISMYGQNQNATEYEIYFSDTGEEDSYEKVFYVKDAKFQIPFSNQTYLLVANDEMDMSNYSKDTVRFMKYHIINGNYARHYNADGTVNYGSNGYNIFEIALMGDVSLLPEKPKNVQVSSTEYDKLTVTWEDVDDEEVTYSIYIDGSAVDTDIPAGTNQKEYKVSAGNHRVKVVSVKNGMENKSEDKAVLVKTETTTPASTTPIPTTKTEVTTSVDTNPGTNSQQTTKKTVVSQKLGKSKITSKKVGKKKISIKFKKVSGAKGYRIQYSLKSNFKNAKTIKTSKTSAVLKKLKKGKKYFIRVQAYKVVNGKTVYGPYSSKVKSKKVK